MNQANYRDRYRATLYAIALRTSRPSLAFRLPKHGYHLNHVEQYVPTCSVLHISATVYPKLPSAAVRLSAPAYQRRDRSS
jgi:hypothetical protein